MNLATPKPGPGSDSIASAHELIELGNRLEATGDLEEAHRKYLEATIAAPGYARGWLNLGIVLASRVRLDEAIEAYDQALAIEPTSAPAHYNRGLALLQTGAGERAEQAFMTAISHRPIFPDAFAALGGALEAQGRYEEAIAALSEALLQSHAHSGYTLNLGLLMSKVGRLDDAEDLLRSACLSNPVDTAVKHALATVLREKGKIVEACHELEPLTRGVSIDIDACSSFLFTLLFSDGISRREIYSRAERIGATIQRRFPAQVTPYNNIRVTSRRLRIGYVSGDFKRHAVAFFALPVVEKHDREFFEVFCYSNTDAVDDVTEKFRTACDIWRDISTTGDVEATQIVRDDAIDILIDLSGHTSRNRLDVFARNPSPVQITWLGYLGTTGLRSMNYRLCDERTDPSLTSAELHTETLLTLSGSQWCYRPYLSNQQATSPPIARNGFATFGSFNQFAKISPTIRHIWSRILLDVPTSRLLIVGVPEGEARRNLHNAFARDGVATDRIEMIARVSIEEYYALFDDVDIALDTTPYSGATTTCDALWMSVPVVTLAGERSAARSSASLLTSAGLPELVAETTEKYIQIASSLAHDIQRLTIYREGLRAQLRGSSLMDEERFVADIEALYRRAWIAWCQNQDRKAIES